MDSLTLPSYPPTGCFELRSHSTDKDIFKAIFKYFKLWTKDILYWKEMYNELPPVTKA